MDIYIKNVEYANQVELRVVLKDKLLLFDIHAFELVKYVGEDWAYLTVASAKNGEQFLARHGSLKFHSKLLHCSRSTSQRPLPALKLAALGMKQADMKLRRLQQPVATRTPLSTHARSQFQSLATGYWSFDDGGRLIFNPKYVDARQGAVIFGKKALCIYLQSTGSADWNWHGRIDIPYSIIEHTIPEFPNAGTDGSITFTLKSPPNIYQILDLEGLHRYTGHRPGKKFGRSYQQPGDKPEPKLKRMVHLHHRHHRNVGLCMVYRITIPSAQASDAFVFIETFAIPDLRFVGTLVQSTSKDSIETEYMKFEHQLAASQLQFATKFQLTSLVVAGVLPPVWAVELLKYISSALILYSDEKVSLAIKHVGKTTPILGPHVDLNHFKLPALMRRFCRALAMQNSADFFSPFDKPRQHQHLMLTYKAIVTPTGLVLQGPDNTIENRLLRKYHQHSDCFLRVAFRDEDGLPVYNDPRASQAEVYERFRNVLLDGLHIAGRHFEFLGYSNSALKSHQPWFMAPFQHKGVWLHARDVIADIGNFSDFQCAARCAARIGQAFSDTIITVPIPATAIVIMDQDDVIRNGYNFSDGCGTISLEMCKMIRRRLPRIQQQLRPTVFQYRLGGAKGVLSLDTDLPGLQIIIRKSSCKFEAPSHWRDLEICGMNDKPLPAFTSHQYIQLFEDRGVSREKFLEIQNEELNAFLKVPQHPEKAAKYLEDYQFRDSALVPQLLRRLHYVGLAYQADGFLINVIIACIMSNLRTMKYKARIRVKDGMLLFGIMDETGFLKEGEVYITTNDRTSDGRKGDPIIRDSIVVTRAPASNPGDMQIVKAVDVPENSRLRKLSDVIVFSQHGKRDLPSQLSGGDLDGDRFHIFLDQRLIPSTTEVAEDYPPAALQNLGRPVETRDIANFTIDHMKNDNLGQIANKHKIRADKSPDGTHDPECKELARLETIAVNFAKSGVSVHHQEIPWGEDRVRPDWASTGYSLVVNDSGAVALQDPEISDLEEPDALDFIDSPAPRHLHYPSDKTLGHLFRNIDEQSFFNRIKTDFAKKQRKYRDKTMMELLDRYIDRETQNVAWARHTSLAEGLRNTYETNLLDIMDSLKLHRNKPLTELEVFSGNILNIQTSAPNNCVKEANYGVQKRYNLEVERMVRRIVHGDEEIDWHDPAEALARSVACFKVAMRREGWEASGSLQSWKYVTAAVCLEQLEKRAGRLRCL